MSGNDPRRDEALRWLRLAAEDQRAAHTCLSVDPPMRGIAPYHCQQAAEKILKGLLIRAAKGFRKVHDLNELADEVARIYPRLDEALDEDLPPPAVEDVAEAIRVTNGLRETALDLI